MPTNLEAHDLADWEPSALKNNISVDLCCNCFVSSLVQFLSFQMQVSLITQIIRVRSAQVFQFLHVCRLADVHSQLNGAEPLLMNVICSTCAFKLQQWEKSVPHLSNLCTCRSRYICSSRAQAVTVKGIHELTLMYSFNALFNSRGRVKPF